MLTKNVRLNYYSSMKKNQRDSNDFDVAAKLGKAF